MNFDFQEVNNLQTSGNLPSEKTEHLKSKVGSKRSSYKYGVFQPKYKLAEKSMGFTGIISPHSKKLLGAKTSCTIQFCSNMPFHFPYLESSSQCQRVLSKLNPHLCPPESPAIWKGSHHQTRSLLGTYILTIAQGTKTHHCYLEPQSPPVSSSGWMFGDFQPTIFLCKDLVNIIQLIANH